MAGKPANLVHVEIFGQTYAVRGADREHVERLAALVDAQMREVSRGSGAVDSLRIAVLAALNIADECEQLRGKAGSGEAEVDSRVRALSRELDRVLED